MTPMVSTATNLKSEVRNPKSSSTRLVIFDLGGVLVRICHGWAKACEHLKLPHPACIDDPQGHALLADVGVRFETGRIDEHAFIIDASRLTGLSHEQVKLAIDHWLIEPYPGVTQLIEQLVGPQPLTPNPQPPSPLLLTACLSNTNATHWAMMNGFAGAPGAGRASVPLHRLHYRFASHLIGAMKPDAKIYEHVEQVTGIAPENILFFDDHPPNVNAARQRGWRVEQIDHAGDTVVQMISHLRRCGVMG